MLRAPSRSLYEGPGPLTAEDLRPGSRYELHDGHPIYCAPTGGDGARSTIAGAEILDTDPAVTEAGIDAGYAPSPGMLRAPDVSVGNVPDAFGWIKGVPPLALEYAGSGQDEAKLQLKIADLLGAGTQVVWVVRLVGPRRIEIHEPARAMRTAGPGELLELPGILKNTYPVEAFYDRATAHRLTMRNLLEREGYASLDEVREEGLEEGLEKGREQGREQGLEEGLEKGREQGREEGLEKGREQGLEKGREQGLEKGREQGLEKGREQGREEGREQGRADALLTVLETRGIAVAEPERARIFACRDARQLDDWLRRAVSASQLADVFG